MTLSGPSAAARTGRGGRALWPHVLHLNPHQLQILFFWIYKIQSPLSVIFTGHVRTTENGKCPLNSPIQGRNQEFVQGRKLSGYH